jgi:7-carboxy-7-deazaguanine synthase
MKVNEIYRSIQGESSFSGLPCVFVRLTYCNLRCTYCDSSYAFYEGKDLTVEEVLEAVEKYKTPLVEITGGEPLLQREVHPLMERLVDSGHIVLLETGGSLDISKVPPKVIKIMDLKCPSSGESHRNLYSNIEKLQPHDEIKFVVGTRQDYLWAKELIARYSLAGRFTLLLSTVFNKIEPREVIEWMLEDGLPFRFQIQLHKYIWDPEARAV